MVVVIFSGGLVHSAIGIGHPQLVPRAVAAIERRLGPPTSFVTVYFSAHPARNPPPSKIRRPLVTGHSSVTNGRLNYCAV
jgi:hypothetical protein